MTGTAPGNPPSTDQTEPRWWESDEAIRVRLAGVFEGGGAKGVAYAGALRATLAQGCWFRAVAGASAGAITAALIAAGLTPDEIAAESDVAFERLRPDGVRAGLSRLRSSFGFLDNDGLLEWLAALLKKQIQAFGVQTPGPVTFATLYRATGIELNVVAADLTRGQQVVFSAWDTGGAQVAEAVLASSAIPFAFPPQSLAVAYGNEAYSHAVVDGGVWSNFPSFVFTDSSFRIAAGRSAIVPDDYVVGFLLDEESFDGGSPDIADSRFVPRGTGPPPREWHVTRTSDDAGPLSPSVVRKLVVLVLSVVVLPVWLLLRFGSWVALGRADAWQGRLPRVKGLAGRGVQMLNDVLSSLHSAWIAGVVMLGIIGGTVVSIRWIVTSFILLRIDELRLDLVFNEGWWPVTSGVIQIALVSVVLALVLASALLTLAAIMANYLVLGAGRQVVYGLGRTYAAGSGAPAWSGVAPDDHVVRLPIPNALTTLSFNRSSPRVNAAIEKAILDAEEATRRKLDALLRLPKLRGGDPRTPRDEVEPVELTPDVVVPSRWGGGPAMAAVRLSVVAIVVGFVLIGAGYVWPDPAWYRYDVNVRACEGVLEAPDDPCDPPHPGAVALTALFGPASSGHRTQAVLKVDGELVERSAEMPNPPEGRIVTLAIDRHELCGERSCTVRVEALVDDAVVYSQEIDLTIDIDYHRG